MHQLDMRVVSKAHHPTCLQFSRRPSLLQQGHSLRAWKSQKLQSCPNHQGRSNMQRLMRSRLHMMCSRPMTQNLWMDCHLTTPCWHGRRKLCSSSWRQTSIGWSLSCARRLQSSRFAALSACHCTLTNKCPKHSQSCRATSLHGCRGPLASSCSHGQPCGAHESSRLLLRAGSAPATEHPAHSVSFGKARQPCCTHVEHFCKQMLSSRRFCK